VNAAGFSADIGQQSREMTEQGRSKRPTTLNLGHLRAELARESPVQRNRGLVGSATIPAGPPSESGLHSAQAPLASDFSFDATRLRRRASASPQSPLSDAVVAAFPMNTRSFVVQWRRILPDRDRTDCDRHVVGRAGRDPAHGRQRQHGCSGPLAVGRDGHASGKIPDVSASVLPFLAHLGPWSTAQNCSLTIPSPSRRIPSKKRKFAAGSRVPVVDFRLV
jgi:hypothetical protein